MDRHELLDLTRQVRHYLDYLASLGVDRVPQVEPPGLDPRPGTEGIRPGPADHSPRPGESLDDIRADLGDCRRCPLSQKRTHIVFGQGPEDARIMFIGEGPGQEEDLQGVPFVGRAGRLLTDIIVKGMAMRREDCYIANIVKCRPPNNRDPLPDEANTCLPFLRRQIEAIRPRVICALGRVAAQYLLATNQSLGRLRHVFHDFNGIPVMPTYHPSFLLRYPEKKRETWEDIKLIIDRLK